jgi:hypothetical protein
MLAVPSVVPQALQGGNWRQMMAATGGEVRCRNLPPFVAPDINGRIWRLDTTTSANTTRFSRNRE